VTFDPNWLALRAAADARARAASTRALVAAVAADPSTRPLEVVDLGGGSANNALHLAPRLADAAPGREQRWRIVDADPALLDHARERTSGLPAEVTTVHADLATEALGGLVDGADLVTASALIDLASAGWLEDLAEACAGAGVEHVLVVLNVDGRVEWEPVVPGDALVIGAFENDMLRDKGLGPALGGAAPGVLAEALGRRDYAVALTEADWDLGAEDAPLQSAYVDGVVAALTERPPPGVDEDELGEWERSRRAAIADGTSRLRVGHLDLLARRG